MRPVPVVFLLNALAAQLSAPVRQYFQSPDLTDGAHCICDGRCVRTLPDLSSRVAAVCAGVLLDVERAAACVDNIVSQVLKHSITTQESSNLYKRTASPAQSVRLVVALAEARSSLRCR